MLVHVCVPDSLDGKIEIYLFFQKKSHPFCPFASLDGVYWCILVGD
jgi:hypothetical protein